MKYLGIDYGSARIGLALGDDETHIAAPLETVEADSLSEAARAVALIIKEEGVEKVVLGLPIAMKGGEGHQAAQTRAFGRELGRISVIEIIYEDERLSSKMADKLMKEVSPENRDAVAAMVILQSYLDKIRNPKHQTTNK